MIQFSDWKIVGEGEIARQHDNLTRELRVEGEIPEGWTWDLLVQAGKNLDIIRLNQGENSLSVILTSEMLALSGFYEMQLRGTQGELVRHTNVTRVYIPESLSGDGQWPEVPSEFTQLEQRMRELSEETGAAAEQAQTAAEDVANNAQAAQEAAEKALEAVEAVETAAKNAETAADQSGESARQAADAKAQMEELAQQVGEDAESMQDAVGQAKSAAQQAGQAQTAAETAAENAEKSAQQAMDTASIIPAPNPENAGMTPVVNEAGDGYELVPRKGLTLVLDTTTEEEVMEIRADFPPSKKIYALISTPAVSKNSTYIKIIYGYKDDPHRFTHMPFCSVPRTLEMKVSTIISIDSGMLQFSANNGTPGAYDSPSIYNGTGNIATLMSVSKARFYSHDHEGTPESLISFSFGAYAADNPFPAGTRCMVWVEEV